MSLTTDLDKFLASTKPPKKRSLKNSEKSKLKKERKNKCERCKKTFYSNILVIHHKKPISKYKTNDISLTNFTIFYETHKKPKYDYKSNLMILCPTCHKIIHNELSKKERKTKKKTSKKKDPYELDIKLPKF